MTPKINTRECWYAKYGEEGLLENTILNHYGLDTYDKLRDGTRTGLVSEKLFDVGKAFKIYTGNRRDDPC